MRITSVRFDEMERVTEDVDLTGILNLLENKLRYALKKKDVNISVTTEIEDEQNSSNDGLSFTFPVTLNVTLTGSFEEIRESFILRGTTLKPV